MKMLIVQQVEVRRKLLRVEILTNYFLAKMMRMLQGQKLKKKMMTTFKRKCPKSKGNSTRSRKERTKSLNQNKCLQVALCAI